MFDFAESKWRSAGTGTTPETKDDPGGRQLPAPFTRPTPRLRAGRVQGFAWFAALPMASRGVRLRRSLRLRLVIERHVRSIGHGDLSGEFRFSCLSRTDDQDNARISERCLDVRADLAVNEVARRCRTDHASIFNAQSV